jgi:hypothetical protein
LSLRLGSTGVLLLLFKTVIRFDYTIAKSRNMSFNRWLHTFVNNAARRRMSQLISKRRAHHRLLLAFNSLKHQGDV